jgi:prophage maintenance system killer protein
MTRNFPTVLEAVDMHDDLIRQFGGESGLRDAGGLESAIMRPQIFVTDAFLRMNGHFIDCDNREAYDYFMELFDTNSFRFAELSNWLADKAKPL